MSNPTTYFGWQMPEPTDLVTDLPADFEVFGQAVDTDLQDLLGGTTGQLLSKTSATDLDFTWVTPNAGDITGVTAGIGISGGGSSGDVTVTNSMATAIDAKGDLIVGTGADAFSRLAVGATNGQVLTVDSGEATGLKYATPAGASGPSFGVYGSAAQNGIPNATFTKAALNTELWDTDNCYDTTLYRFTPNKSGYYQINTNIERTVTSISFAIISVYKNGSSFNRVHLSDSGVNFTANCATLVYLNGTTDYIEWFVYLDGGTRNIQNDSDQITTGVWIRS